MTARKPNILYIHSHDTGRYVQPYGYPIPTANIQKLAEGGVVFRNAFNAAPTCSPSRAALLTGQCPHSCGQFGLANRGFTLPDCSKHLVHTLKAAGYYTALVGIQHIVRDSGTIGYDSVLPERRWAAHDVVPEALKFLESSPKKPFFLSCGFGDTHRVFQPRSLAEDPRWCRPPAPMPDAPETRQDMARFAASARVLDQAMGTVFAALEENGLADDTLVICTTDHGIAFPRMKCHLNDHGTGVMLIMRGPGGFRGGVVNDALVSHVDLFPTLCDLLGIEPPAWLEGTSLVPLVTGAAAEVNEAVFSENNYHASYEPMRTVRTKRWRYIRRFHSREVPFLANCDAGPTKTLLLENGWQDRGLVEEKLYDLVFDPNEACNVAGDASAREALEEMRGRLDRWMKETDDPLLKGDIPLPEGAVVNRPDDRDPFDVWQYTDRPDHLA